MFNGYFKFVYNAGLTLDLLSKASVANIGTKASEMFAYRLKDDNKEVVVKACTNNTPSEQVINSLSGITIDSLYIFDNHAAAKQFILDNKENYETEEGE